MILYLVRHGKPDYTTDTLLPEGWEQARRVSNRLAASGLDAIYSSPMGRARETAQPTAERLGLPIQVEEWAHELGHESDALFPDGSYRTISELPHEHFHKEPLVSLTQPQALACAPGLTDTHFAERVKELGDGLDGLLARNGYARQPNGLYLATEHTDRHIALFCHAGMTRVLVSHLMHIPVHLLMTASVPHFTAVTAFLFHREEHGPETTPILMSFGDCGHLYDDQPLTACWHHVPFGERSIAWPISTRCASSCSPTITGRCWAT